MPDDTTQAGSGSTAGSPQHPLSPSEADQLALARQQRMEMSAPIESIDEEAAPAAESGTILEAGPFLLHGQQTTPPSAGMSTVSPPSQPSATMAPQAPPLLQPQIQTTATAGSPWPNGPHQLPPAQQPVIAKYMMTPPATIPVATSGAAPAYVAQKTIPVPSPQAVPRPSPLVAPTPQVSAATAAAVQPAVPSVPSPAPAPALTPTQARPIAPPARPVIAPQPSEQLQPVLPPQPSAGSLHIPTAVSTAAAGPLASPVPATGETNALAPPLSPLPDTRVGLTSTRHGSRPIYSHNTKAVWQARRRNRILVTTAWVVVLGLCIAGVVYWLSIGSPTKVEDIPLVRQLIGS